METQVHPVRFQRPERAKIEQLKEIGSATLSAELKHKAGIRNSHIIGPVTQEKGRVIGGPAITLQFMPIREDYYDDKSEYQEVEKQLHRHALYLAEAGDVVVVDAREDMVTFDGKALVEDGHIQVPEAPGLGIELNEEVVQAHLNPPTPELSGFFESTDSWNVLDSHDRLWS